MAALPTTTSAGFLEVGAKRTSRANKGLLGTVFKSSLSSDGHDEPDDETELLTSDAEGAEPDVTEVKPPQRPRDLPRKNPVRLSTSASASRQGSFSSFWSSVASLFGRGVNAPTIAASSSSTASDRRKSKGTGTDDDEESVDELTRIKRAGVLADTNKDNRLDEQELLRFAEEVRERRRWAMTKETMRKRDNDRNGKISKEEVEKELATAYQDAGRAIGKDDAGYLKAKFDAADADKSRELDENEFHVYVHPEVEPKVLEIEVGFQFRIADHDHDGRVSLEEFFAEAERGEDEAEFSREDASADFEVHDTDTSMSLDRAEYTEYVKGQVLLKKHVKMVMDAGDEDGDGQIDLREELVHRKAAILDCEFVEDYFILHRRDEL